MEHKDKIISVVMVVVAVIFALLALYNGYAATSRFFANSALDRYTINHLQRDIRGMRNAAKDAESWLGTDARSVLPTVDPLASGADEQFARLLSAVPAEQRYLVTTARNFTRAIHDQELESSDQMRGSDAILVNYIKDSRSSAGPLKIPELDSFMPADFYILRRALEEQLRLAWLKGGTKDVIDAAGALRFYDNQHPLTTVFYAFVAATDPTIKDSRTAINTMREQQRLTKDLAKDFARRFVALVSRDPADLEDADLRLKEALKIIPAHERTAQESSLWMQTAGGDINVLAKSAKSSGSAPVIITAINRCFAAGRNDLALDLAGSLDESTQRKIQLAVAEREWDLKTIQELAPNPEAYMPVVRQPNLGDGYLAFHVSSPTGAVPDKTLTITVDGADVAADKQQRFGSIINVPITHDGSGIQLSVSLDQTVIFDGRVAP